MAPNFKDDSLPLISPERVEKQRKEILFDNYYYDVTNWIPRHPGGRVIEYYTETGEDSTLAIQEFHQRSHNKVRGIMKSFQRRPANNFECGPDKETLERQRALTKDFLELHHQLETEGYFQPSMSHVVYRIFELVTFLTCGIICQQMDSIFMNTLGIILVAFFHGRVGFLCHESGHRALTGRPKVDKWIQTLVFGLGNGLSSSWWSRSHNMHHAMPQRINRDVDLDTLPLIAFNAKVAENSKQGKSFWIQNQARLFLMVDTFLVNLFWRVYLHPRYAILKGQYHEIGLMVGHYIFLLNFIGLWPLLAGFWLSSAYMFGIFSLSHSHLPVTSTSLHWIEYSYFHTIDIEQSWWCDWFMGWLNYQIEHHLFPSVPHFRLHEIRQRVQNLAVKHNLPYRCLPFDAAVKKTWNNLKNVSKQLEH